MDKHRNAYTRSLVIRAGIKMPACPICREEDVDTVLQSHPCGYWLFVQNEACILCGEKSHEIERLPFGSDYWQESICGDCVHKYLDPIIDTHHEIQESQAA